MFEPKKPTSEFTQTALDGVQKQLSEVTGFSLSYIYGMLAGTHPDHMDYARDFHRGLAIHRPEAAADYRGLLESDAALVGKGRNARTPDKSAMVRLCHGLISAYLCGEDEDVDSAARKLHAALSVRLSAKVYAVGRAEAKDVRQGTG